MGVPVNPIPSSSIHNKWSAMSCEKRVNVSDIHVVLVVNDVGDAVWVPIAVEDSSYLILDHEPDATCRFGPNKLTSLNDGHKLRIGDSYWRLKQLNGNVCNELVLTST